MKFVKSKKDQFSEKTFSNIETKSPQSSNILILAAFLTYYTGAANFLTELQ